MFEEVGDSIGDTLKTSKKFLSKKVILILGGGVALLLLFALFNKNKSKDSIKTVVSDNSKVDDYATVPENADTVISTLENLENYNHNETMAGLENIYNIVTNTGTYSKTGTYNEENKDKLNDNTYEVSPISKIIASKVVKSDTAIGKTMHNVVYTDGSVAIISDKNGKRNVQFQDKKTGKKFEGVI